MSAQLRGFTRNEFGWRFDERSAWRVLSEVCSDKRLMGAQLGGTVRDALGLKTTGRSALHDLWGTLRETYEFVRSKKYKLLNLQLSSRM